MIRDTTIELFYNKLESDSSNLPSMWSIVNDILSRKPLNELKPSYCIDDHETTDKFQIATGFYQYFANVGKNFASAV